MSCINCKNRDNSFYTLSWSILDRASAWIRSMHWWAFPYERGWMRFPLHAILLLNLMAAAVAGVWLSGRFINDTWSQATAGFSFACSAWVLASLWPPVSPKPPSSGSFPSWYCWGKKHGMNPAGNGPSWRACCCTRAACWSHGITAGLMLLGMSHLRWSKLAAGEPNEANRHPVGNRPASRYPGYSRFGNGIRR